jgi:uncharacterized protein (TIGR03083 family)
MLEVLSAEAELLAASARGQRAERAVPACPGLNLGETARHVGSLHRMALSWLREGPGGTPWPEDPEPGQDLADYVLAGARPLIAELAAHDPAQTWPSWWPEQQNRGFWLRRMLHETTVHRTDVQGAAGLPLDPVDDDVAADGVDEVLFYWFAHRLRVLGVTGTRDGSVAISTAGRLWLARSGPAGSHVLRVPLEPGADPAAGNRDDVADAVITGTPVAVYRWLWGRVPDRAVRSHGDADSIAQLWALLRLATR